MELVKFKLVKFNEVDLSKLDDNNVKYYVVGKFMLGLTTELVPLKLMTLGEMNKIEDVIMIEENTEA